MDSKDMYTVPAIPSSMPGQGNKKGPDFFRFDSNDNFGQVTDFSDIFSKLFGGAAEDPFAGQRGVRRSAVQHPVDV